MTRHHRRPTPTRLSRSMVGLLILLVGGCTNQGDATEASSAATFESTTSEATTTQEITVPTWEPDEPVEWEATPLDVALGYDVDRTGLVTSEDVKQACMARNGFDYIPLRPVDPPPGSELGPVSYAHEHGFGITTLHHLSFRQIMVDFNEPVLDAMSDSDRAAWEHAMFGGPATQTGTPQSAGGCQEEAQVVTRYDPAVTRDLWRSIDADLVTLDETIRTDPRVVAAEADWQACMTDRGHGVDTIDGFLSSVRHDLGNRLAILTERHPFDWTGGLTEAEIAERTTPDRYPELLEIFEAQAIEFLEVFLPLGLADLQAEERRLAVDHLECKGDFDVVAREVRIEHEQAFVGQHHAILGQIRQLEGRCGAQPRC